MSTKKFGKYRSRRKRSTKKTMPLSKNRVEAGAGLLGDIGDAVSGIGDFVQKSGKAVADVAETVAPVLGKGVEYIGSQIHDDIGIGKAIEDVGSFTAKHSKAAAHTLGKASPYIGKGMSYIGGKMRDADPEETGGSLHIGGSLFDSFEFKHGHHAAEVHRHLHHGHHLEIRNAAKYITGAPLEKNILHHRPQVTVAMRHFRTIANSTHKSLQQALKNDHTGDLHKAYQTSMHSAHVGGSLDIGGSLIDEIGKKFAKTAKVVGGIGLATAPIVTMMNPAVGAAWGAASGVTAGIGAAVDSAYK